MFTFVAEVRLVAASEHLFRTGPFVVEFCSPSGELEPLLHNLVPVVAGSAKSFAQLLDLLVEVVAFRRQGSDLRFETFAEADIQAGLLPHLPELAVQAGKLVGEISQFLSGANQLCAQGVLLMLLLSGALVQVVLCPVGLLHRVPPPDNGVVSVALPHIFIVIFGVQWQRLLLVPYIHPQPTELLHVTAESSDERFQYAPRWQTPASQCLGN